MFRLSLFRDTHIAVSLHSDCVAMSLLSDTVFRAFYAIDHFRFEHDEFLKPNVL